MAKDSQDGLRPKKSPDIGRAILQSKGFWITIVDLLILLAIFMLIRTHLNLRPAEQVCIAGDCYSLAVERVKVDRSYRFIANTDSNKKPGKSAVSFFVTDKSGVYSVENESVLYDTGAIWNWDLLVSDTQTAVSGSYSAIARFDFGHRVQVPIQFRVWKKDVEFASLKTKNAYVNE